MQRFTALLVTSVVLIGCNGTPVPIGGEINEQQLATAEAFIDAFYSFDPRRLDVLLGHAAKSKPEILYYQGWAEGGNYTITERKPCATAGADSIACPITVDDDLINALGITWDVTDTFTLTFSGGDIISVETSSNDPTEFYEAETWIKNHHPELVEVPCQVPTTSNSTPGACVKATVEGFKQFAANNGS